MAASSRQCTKNEHPLIWLSLPQLSTPWRGLVVSRNSSTRRIDLVLDRWTHDRYFAIEDRWNFPFHRSDSPHHSKNKCTRCQGEKSALLYRLFASHSPHFSVTIAALESAMVSQLWNVAMTVKNPKQAIEPFFSPSKMLRVSKTCAKNPFGCKREEQERKGTSPHSL